MISCDLDALRLRLLLAAHRVMLESSEEIEAELEEGTMRYMSSAYCLNLLPGIVGCRVDAHTRKAVWILLHSVH